MNPFGLEIVDVQCETPATRIVSADRLDALLEPLRLQRAARSRAAQVLRRARAERDRITRAAHEHSRALVEAAQPLIDARAREAADQAVGQAVRWMLEQRDLEQDVCARIETHVRGMLASMLEDLRAPREISAALSLRVSEELQRLGGETASLRVHPQALEALRNALGDTAGIELDTDPALDPGEAVLSTSLLQVHIDLATQLDQMIGALRGEAVPISFSGEL